MGVIYAPCMGYSAQTQSFCDEKYGVWIHIELNNMSCNILLLQPRSRLAIFNWLESNQCEKIVLMVSQKQKES